MGWVVCISTVSSEEEVNGLKADPASVFPPSSALSVIHNEEGLGGTGPAVPSGGLPAEARPSPDEEEEEALSSPLPARGKNGDEEEQLADWCKATPVTVVLPDRCSPSGETVADVMPLDKQQGGWQVVRDVSWLNVLSSW